MRFARRPGAWRSWRAAPSAVLALAILATAAPALAGCALVPSPWVGRWELATIGGDPPAAAASIVFTNTDVVIETGCNTGAGRYRLDGSRLTLEAMAFTAGTCDGDPLVRQDATFRALASGTPTATIDGDRLTIDAGAGAPGLSFVRTSGA